MERQAKLNELLGKMRERFVRTTKEGIRDRADIIGVTLTESQVDEVLYHYMEEVWVDDMSDEERIDRLIAQVGYTMEL